MTLSYFSLFNLILQIYASCFYFASVNFETVICKFMGSDVIIFHGQLNYKYTFYLLIECLWGVTEWKTSTWVS